MKKLQLSIFCLSILIHNGVHSQLIPYYNRGCEIDGEPIDACSKDYCGPYGCPNTATMSTLTNACMNRGAEIGSSSCICQPNYYWDDIHKVCLEQCTDASCAVYGKICVKGSTARGSSYRCVCDDDKTQLSNDTFCVDYPRPCFAPRSLPVLTEKGTIMCTCPKGRTYIPSTRTCVDEATVTCNNYIEFACASQNAIEAEIICGCKAGYHFVENQCVAFPSCNCGANSKCVRGIVPPFKERCDCDDGFVNVNGKCRAVPEGMSCTGENEIVTWNEKTDLFECLCVSDFWKDPYNKCVEIVPMT